MPPVSDADREQAAAVFLRYVRTGEPPTEEERRVLDAVNEDTFARQLAECPQLADLLQELSAAFPAPPTPEV